MKKPMKRTKTKKVGSPEDFIQPELPVVDPPENSTGFKFKVTNLRKSAYPTNYPEVSDYYGFKVHDLIAKGNYHNSVSGPIYEITGITRKEMTEHEYTVVKTSVKKNQYNSDTRCEALLEEYKKNGNFGVCYIEAIPKLRGSKPVAKGRKIIFDEIMQTNPFTYRGYSKVDLPGLINIRQNNINYGQRRVKSEQDKVQTQILVKKALEDLMIQRAPTVLAEAA